MSKIAFIFPGQASQYVGMGKDLYESSEHAKKLYDRANEILGFDIKKVSFEGPLEKLKQTKITQPAIFILSVIINDLLKQKGIEPVITAGHSLGEYSALVCAGALSFEDAIKVVALRGSEMQKACENNAGTMAAVVGLPDDELIFDICREASSSGTVQPANFNSPGQIVISGSLEGVRSGMQIAKSKGAKIVKELVVSGAFHSPLMNSAIQPLSDKLSEVTFSAPFIPVVPNVTAKPTSNTEDLKKLLTDQVTSPVLWSRTVKIMIDEGTDTFIEAGPGNVLKGLGRRISREVNFTGVQTLEELNNLSV
ncbi:MAG: ACP S-malonyltransferase [Candidatus Delongbacteria bacterium]